jgi:hypothetical protein
VGRGCGGAARREVHWPGAAERADGEVAQAGHGLRAGPGAQLGGVLGEGHIPHPAQAVLDRPVPTEQVGEPGGASLSVGRAGDRVDDHGPPPSGAKVAGLAGDLDDPLHEAGADRSTAARRRPQATDDRR